MRDYGFYAQPGDAASLARQVLRALDDAPARARAVSGLRARAESAFSWDDAARRIAAVYDAVRMRRRSERTRALRALSLEPARGGPDAG